MLPNTHELHHLFDQLGLPSEEADIDRFLARHHLQDDERIFQAQFFTPQQQAFLKEGWKADSDWCTPIDQLDLRLRQPH